MYEDRLSNIFEGKYDRKKRFILRDSNDYPWGFKAKKLFDHNTKKVFYVIGDSWLDIKYFNRVFLNDYPDYFLINRSLQGMTNATMLDLIKNDMTLLKSLDTDPIFLVAFSEVGRSIMDFHSCNPGRFSSAHDYFGFVLKNQYETVKNIIGEYQNYITTAFVTNNFNDNLSIIDFCSTNISKPENVFSVYSNGIFEYLKDRSAIFKFNFINDIDKSLELKSFMESHCDIDNTLHPNCYKVYEDFLENVFSNLNIR